MRTLALDPVTGDLVIASGRPTLVEGADAVAQKLRLRLSIWQGEWFADTLVGIPYLGILGVKGSEAFAKATLDRAVDTCPGVAVRDSSSFTLGADRRAVYSFSARAITGEPIEVTDFAVGP